MTAIIRPPKIDLAPPRAQLICGWQAHPGLPDWLVRFKGADDALLPLMIEPHFDRNRAATEPSPRRESNAG
jgi:hypothetical protein